MTSTLERADRGADGDVTVAGIAADDAADRSGVRTHGSSMTNR